MERTAPTQYGLISMDSLRYQGCEKGEPGAPDSPGGMVRLDSTGRGADMETREDRKDRMRPLLFHSQFSVPFPSFFIFGNRKEMINDERRTGNRPEDWDGGIEKTGAIRFRRWLR
jgi:hypothetical protein